MMSQYYPQETVRNYNMRSAPQLTPKVSNEATCLEYGLLKVPYEMLNRKFRTTIKRLGKPMSAINNLSTSIEGVIPRSSQALPIAKINDKYRILTKKVEEFASSFQDSINAEIEIAKVLQNRAEYLNKGVNGDEQDIDYFRRQRVCRLLVDHLLRIGYFETAQKLADYTGIEAYTNQEIFQVAKQVEESLKRQDLSIFAKQVEESLKRQDLSICLQWIADNRSKLHRLNSIFETEVHVQYAVELVKAEKRKEALEYVQKNLQNLGTKQWKGNVLTLMTIIGAGSFPGAPYQKLLSDDRWAELIEMFRVENARIFNISTLSPFSASLQLGICAHKTPYCTENENSRCIVCKELFDFSLGLPYAHINVSRLICPYNGEVIDESNVPMMLPNGQVYGENSIQELRRGDDEIYDPNSDQHFALRDVKRVFIL
uniref:Macrophage erythroblast attacher n=1 Tax=Panagrolaimus sp. ES5 TaxID=591445 RepID=A0AC34G219_9BILA